MTQIREQGPAFGRDLDPPQVVGEAALALSDVQEVADADRPFAALQVEKSQAPFLFAVDEEVLREDDALAEGLGREVDHELLELGREFQADEGDDVRELEVDAELVEESRPELLGPVVPREPEGPIPALGE